MARLHHVYESADYGQTIVDLDHVVAAESVRLLTDAGRRRSLYRLTLHLTTGQKIVEPEVHRDDIARLNKMLVETR